MKLGSSGITSSESLYVPFKVTSWAEPFNTNLPLRRFKTAISVTFPGFTWPTTKLLTVSVEAFFPPSVGDL